MQHVATRPLAYELFRGGRDGIELIELAAVHGNAGHRVEFAEPGTRTVLTGQTPLAFAFL